MTDEMMPLDGLVERRADTDLLRERVEFAAERLTELERGGRTKSALDAKWNWDWDCPDS